MDLGNAATWFFESIEHVYPTSLRIRLVEGIKGDKREMVEVAEDQSIGPYFPVKVTKKSRCIDVICNSVLSFQLVDESFSAPQTDFKSERIQGPLHECRNIEYLAYLERDTLISSLRKNEYTTYFIWTEDQTIFVVATQEPSIELSSDQPDTSIERSLTYMAS